MKKIFGLINFKHDLFLFYYHYNRLQISLSQFCGLATRITCHVNVGRTRAILYQTIVKLKVQAKIQNFIVI